MTLMQVTDVFWMLCGEMGLFGSLLMFCLPVVQMRVK
jgi:hypothetical protein